MCKECGEGYHTTTLKPKKEGQCDKCGGELITRPDDSSNAIKNRLEVYYKSTEPLKTYYSEKNLVKNVDGSKSIEEVVEETLKILS